MSWVEIKEKKILVNMMGDKFDNDNVSKKQ